MPGARSALLLSVCALGCGGGAGAEETLAPSGPAAYDAGEVGALADAAVPTGPSGPALSFPEKFLALPFAAPVPSGLPHYDAPVLRPFDTLYQAQDQVPPLSGGTLARSASGRVVIADPDRDLVHVVSSDWKSVSAIAIGAGREPFRIEVVGERAFVVLRGAGALATLDLTKAVVTSTLPICAAPRGLAFDAPSNRLLVACAGGDLVSVAADGSRVLGKTFVARDLRDVGRDAQGVWVTQYRSATLLHLDASLREAARQRPADVNVRLPLSSVEPDRAFAPTLAWRTIRGPGEEPLMLHQRAQSSVVRLQSSLGLAAGTYGPAPNNRNSSFCESGIVHTTLSRFGAEPIAPPQPALPQAVVPTDVSSSPDAAFVAVVAPGNFVDDSLIAGAPRNRQLYLFPASVLRSSDPPRLLNDDEDCLHQSMRVEHRFPGEATSVLFWDARTLLVQVRNPSELHVMTLGDDGAPRLRQVLTLASSSVRDSGHEVFHQNTGAGIACASCHGEALDDAHVWSFDIGGVRRTQQLRGGVLSRAPFHWSGDLHTLDDLLADVYVKRMGGSQLEAPHRGALGRWLDKLPIVPAEARDPSAASRGKALFESKDVGCTDCHAGPAMGSTALYDVGTGGAFKAPSLRNVSLRLPVMHDGCADTLQKRFDPVCGGSAHGKTAGLTPAQLADLVAYLESL